MTAEQIAFFELVRAGLWGRKADASVFDEHTEWHRLYAHGKNQTMLGIMLDGIQTLPDELRPDRLLYLQWCASVLQTEDNNRKINREICSLFNLLRSYGIEPVLLKGQGVGRHYREPLHRQCGDIDIYIGKRDFERVNRLLLESGEEICEATAKHNTFCWHGVEVENHRMLAQLMSPCANRRLQRSIAAWHGMREERFVLDGCGITVPPADFDAIFLLLHSVHHLLEGGVGLRQICDWIMLLHNSRESMDLPAVAHELTKLGLSRAARIFGALSVGCLGMNADELPLPFDAADEREAEWLLDNIWTNGNFGRGDATRKPRPKGYWSGKWHTFRSALYCLNNMGRVAPSEARWTPVMMICNMIYAQIYMRFRRRRA